MKVKQVKLGEHHYIIMNQSVVEFGSHPHDSFLSVEVVDLKPQLVIYVWAEVVL